MFSARRLRQRDCPGLLTPLIPPERNRCHVDYQYGSASPASRSVRHRPVELTVDGVSAEGAAIAFRADCAVDRYAHGITMMPGLAARRLSVQIAARATRA
jgi:hypothetical protein